MRRAAFDWVFQMARSDESGAGTVHAQGGTARSDQAGTYVGAFAGLGAMGVRTTDTDGFSGSNGVPGQTYRAAGRRRARAAAHMTGFLRTSRLRGHPEDIQLLNVAEVPWIVGD